MKKIIASLLLMTCGVVILLATVDLEPYLAQEKPQSPKITAGVTKDADRDEAKDATSSEDSYKDDIFPQIEPKQDLASENLPAEENQDLMQEDTPDTGVVAQPSHNKYTNNQIVETGTDTILLPEGEYPFSILLETFNGEESARKAIPSYRHNGVSAYWVKVDLGKKRIKYRLFAGVFPTTTVAQHYLAQHNLINKPIKLTRYSALVGVYPDRDQLDTAYRKTANAGVVPYSLETKQGLYFLYVGAFYTFAGASTQCQDLTAAGLSCMPVNRSTLLEQ